jgi:hypothetical protein
VHERGNGALMPRRRSCSCHDDVSSQQSSSCRYAGPHRLDSALFFPCVLVWTDEMTLALSQNAKPNPVSTCLWYVWLPHALCNDNDDDENG